MSRKVKSVYPMLVGEKGELIEHPLHLIMGNDHAIGQFVDFIDRRFAGTEHDPQGEGYIYEESYAFGVGTNRADITRDEVRMLLSNEPDPLIKKVETWLISLGIITEEERTS